MNHVELALNMAHKSESRFRLGAVLAKRNKVISTGYNQMRKTHPLQEKYNNREHTIGLHAEVHACLSVDIADLQGAELFVARVLKNGNQALAKPCETCVRFMRDVGIKSVTYTTTSCVSFWEL